MFRTTVICAILALIAGLFLLAIPPFPGSGPDSNHTLSGESAGSDPAVLPDGPVVDDLAAEQISADDGSEPDLERVPLEASGARIAGRVIDKVTGEPVREFLVLIEDNRRGYGLKEAEVIRETVRDEEGCFSCPVEPGPQYGLHVFSPCHVRWERGGLSVPGGPEVGRIVVALKQGETLQGRVVDDVTGAPVEGVSVGTLQWDRFTEILPSGLMEGSNRSTTGTDGRFRLSGLPPEGLRQMDGRVCIVALHPNYAGARAIAVPGQPDLLELRLPRGYSLFGVVRDDRGVEIEGVRISAYDRNWVIRYAESGLDGSYRTGRLMPGPIRVHATDYGRLPGAPLRFTYEKKTVEMTDGDVRVDFGPGESHLTWRGTLRDGEGNAVPGGRITIEKTKTVDQEKYAGYCQCDDQGRFEFRKLEAREYSATVRLPDSKVDFPAGKYPFEQPGSVERAIMLPSRGGTLCGVVIDEATGRPASTSVLNSGHPYITLIESGGERRTRTVRIDTADATFRVDQLVAGTYWLLFRSVKPQEISITEGCVLEGVRVVLERRGTLGLTLEGFAGEELESLLVRVESPYPTELDLKGKTEHKFGFPPGQQLIRIGGRIFCVETRTFEITADMTTPLTVHRNELTPLATELEITGRVTRADGTPVAGAALRFASEDRPFGESGWIKCRTDGDGWYSRGGFTTGHWWALCHLSDGNSVVLSALGIPLEIPDGFTLDLVLPTATVSGSFRDATSLVPIDGGGVEWIVSLRSNDGSYSEARRTGTSSSQFTIEYVTPGRYRVFASVPGYFWKRTDWIEVEEGQSVDVGVIDLEPSGFLDVSAVDSTGASISHFNVYLDGKRAGGMADDNRWTSPARSRRVFWNIPPGKRRLRIEAPGHMPKELDIHLEPARRSVLRVELAGGR